MSVADDFGEFLNNIKVTNDSAIGSRYDEVTAALNKRFRETDSKTANSIRVGSYGRWTAIKGISDLDMIYILPASQEENYNKEGGQRALLCDVKDAINSRYPRTAIKVDRLVVAVQYKDFRIEVMPVFEHGCEEYKYPDTKNGGKWKVTKPKAEIEEMKAANERKNRNLRRLCKMARAWKNKCGLAIGGLLIDTLAYNFMESTTEYDKKSYLYYGEMCRDFFKFLSEQPEQDKYAALGSGQWVKVKKRFDKKADQAYELCVTAIAAAGQANERQKWRDVFGNAFPAPVSKPKREASFEASSFRDTEEFIEDKYPIDIRYNMTIDCEVTQNGFRLCRLREFLKNSKFLRIKKSLRFFITDDNTLPDDAKIYWKVLNCGDVAESRDMIRGQILPDKGRKECKESTNFYGGHKVECYAVLNGVVVARDSIPVPIGLKEEYSEL